jgi:myo-inositol-1-phosphate synthase
MIRVILIGLGALAGMITLGVLVINLLPEMKLDRGILAYVVYGVDTEFL